MNSCLEPTVVERTADLSSQYFSAKPFQHVVIDNFLKADIAQSIATNFPAASNSGSKNLYGAPGEKIVHSDLSKLGPTFQEVDAFFGSQTALDWLTAVTGIHGLVYDPTNYGGGTHENCDNRDLRPHVDFNFHPVTKLHRRLNLIVYLNANWESAWGGSIQLYANPRDPDDVPVSYEPLFNRCILFATHEASWHGFDRLCFPKDGVYRSRKSLSLYFYTADRPTNEIHNEHTTFFIPRPLPTMYRAGYSLTNDDEVDLKELIGQRDRLIELYQSEQGRREDNSSELAQLRILVSQLQKSRQVPILGYVRALENLATTFPDGWNASDFAFRVRIERRVTSIIFTIRIPDGMPEDSLITVTINDHDVASAFVAPGILELPVKHTLEANTITEISIHISKTVNHYKLGISKDQRNLGFYLECATFEHTDQPT